MNDPRWVVAGPAPASVPVRGSEARFPVHRIYCVGRNYAGHAREMGVPAERGPRPVFFCKPADAVVTDDGDVPYPSATGELHHEVELVLALGRDADGVVAPEQAAGLVFGIGVGLDLTRRDLQAECKEQRLPWDIAKAFDGSAPISALVPLAGRALPQHERLWLEVAGSLRQQSHLDSLLWDLPSLLHQLSKLFRLRAGDLVFTGTPAGVAALDRGDTFRAGLDGWIEFSGRVV